MNDTRYRWILYVIVLVILSTIGIQVYWNYKNYLSNKQQLVNDVQVSLDNAVEAYYANIVEDNTIDASSDSIFIMASFGSRNNQVDSVIKTINSLRTFNRADTLNAYLINDSIPVKHIEKIDRKGFRPNALHFQRPDHLIPDSLYRKRIRKFTDRVLISMTRDTLALEDIDSLLKIELLRKKINIDYTLTFKSHFDKIRKLGDIKLSENALSTQTKSSYLQKGSFLKINFSNGTGVILRRIFWGIFTSTILILALIACLFYLLHIIRHQKQLAEVKNDLINNITHEFKTPIATIGVALESIKDFNVIDDKEKTKSYLEMSNNQLSKLNVMVEKLLETATLDSDGLQLNKESVNIADLMGIIVNKHSIQTKDKIIRFKPSKDIFVKVDIFHFENVFNNLIDNAVKYGGREINVELSQNNIAFTVEVSDNGTSLTKVNKDKIFEQFYRVPKGNTHDVKGFGIGLYYAKKIIEKHEGIIFLDLDNNLTTFKISLPNG